MRAPNGVTKVASSRETPIGPIHGFDVFKDGKRICKPCRRRLTNAVPDPAAYLRSKQ